MSEFLCRWSKLKRGAAAPEQPEEAPAPAALPAEPVDSAAPAVAEEPAFDLSLLPSLEELTTETDIRGFLHKAVPAGMRNAALKRMWALDPAIRDFVGPVDYAWDFNDPAGLPGISEALTGDVSELLARAIGAAPQQATDEIDAEAALQPEVSPQAATLPKQSPLPELASDNAEVTVSVKRHHGGALPVLFNPGA